MKRCSACNVPKRITATHKWLHNGTIVETKNPAHRMLFMECDNITGVFSRIEEILGVPVEGVFELASGREAGVTWELAEDGDLTVEASWGHR